MPVHLWMLLSIAVTLAGLRDPVVTRLQGRWGYTQDSTVTYRARVTLSTPLGSSDSIRYTLYQNGAQIAAVRSQRTDTTFLFPAGAYESTTLNRLCARWFRVNTAFGQPRCAERSFTRGPAPAGEVIDIQLEPETVGLRGGDSTAFAVRIERQP